MKTLALLILLAASTLNAAEFDALNAAPESQAIAPPVQATDAQRFQARMSEAARKTYRLLFQAYIVNHATLTGEGDTLTPAAKVSALTSAQLAEVLTIQWQIYNVLKSINPKLDLQPPPASSVIVEVKPAATPKKAKTSPTPKKK